MNLEKLVNTFMTHPLSGEDIMTICNNKAKIIVNSQLKNVTHIDEIFDKNDAVILLYDRDDGTPGHWSGLTRNGNTITFFCPYGFAPDYVTKHIGGKVYLLKLLFQSNYKIIYNTKKLQQLKNNISVCGRYVGMFLLLKRLPLNMFIGLISKNKHYTSDFWITLLTLFCEN